MGPTWQRPPVAARWPTHTTAACQWWCPMLPCRPHRAAGQPMPSTAPVRMVAGGRKGGEGSGGADGPTCSSPGLREPRGAAPFHVPVPACAQGTVAHARASTSSVATCASIYLCLNIRVVTLRHSVSGKPPQMPVLAATHASLHACAVIAWQLPYKQWPSERAWCCQLMLVARMQCAHAHVHDMIIIRTLRYYYYSDYTSLPAHGHRFQGRGKALPPRDHSQSFHDLRQLGHPHDVGHQQPRAGSDAPLAAQPCTRVCAHHALPPVGRSRSSLFVERNWGDAAGKGMPGPSRQPQQSRRGPSLGVLWTTGAIA